MLRNPSIGCYSVDVKVCIGFYRDSYSLHKLHRPYHTVLTTPHYTTHCTFHSTPNVLYHIPPHPYPWYPSHDMTTPDNNPPPSTARFTPHHPYSTSTYSTTVYFTVPSTPLHPNPTTNCSTFYNKLLPPQNHHINIHSDFPHH
jgi:hypothetical protein